MQSSFNPLTERLLRGGVGRNHARRYIEELGDHLDDIVAEERLKGTRVDLAQARERLGSDEALAEMMICRREFRAWSDRAPLLAYLALPCFLLVAGIAAAMEVIVLTCSWLRQASSALALPPWTPLFSQSMMFVSNAILPVLLGWIMTAAAISQRSRPAWPVIGILALAALSSGLQVGVMLPSVPGHGEISLDSSHGYIARFARDAALMLTPYVGLSAWRILRWRMSMFARG